METVLAFKLSDADNPGTAPAWVALLGVVLVALLLWRCLLPQALGLAASLRDRRRHRAAMLKWRQKGREGDPPGR